MTVKQKTKPNISKKPSKACLIDGLSENISKHNFIYFIDAMSMRANDNNEFRRECFSNNIDLCLAKNTLASIALKKSDKSSLLDYKDKLLKSSTLLMMCSSETGREPALILEKIKKEKVFSSKVLSLKGAYIDGNIFLGDESIPKLSKLRSRSEILGALLNSLKSRLPNLLISVISHKKSIS